MLNLNTVEPNFIIVTKDISKDELLDHLKTVGRTVVFDDFKRVSLADFLLDCGFERVSSSIKVLYFIIIDSHILVINVEGFDVKEKFWVKLTDENLKYVRTFGNDSDNFFLATSNDYQSGYDLYDISLDKPFAEYFVFIHGHEATPLRRCDFSFKYEHDKFIIVNIYSKKSAVIQIFYENHECDVDAFFADSIDFGGGKFLYARMLNRKRGASVEIHSNSDIVDTSTITLENYHLFWERLTPEQNLLLEMSRI